MPHYSPSKNAFYLERHFGQVMIDGERNPDCKMPSDVVEITDAEHKAIFDELAQPHDHKILQADKNGKPVLVEKVFTKKELAMQEYKILEDSITNVRITDAVLGTDKGWLKETREKMAALEKKIK